MKKNRKLAALFAEEALPPQGGRDQPTILRMRLSAGKHAVSAAEAEVRIDGARVAGGTGTFEFDLYAETWVEIVVIRG